MKRGWGMVESDFRPWYVDMMTNLIYSGRTDGGCWAAGETVGEFA